MAKLDDTEILASTCSVDEGPALSEYSEILFLPRVSCHCPGVSCHRQDHVGRYRPLTRHPRTVVAHTRTVARHPLTSHG